MKYLRSFSQRGLDTVLSVLFFVIPLAYAWLYIPGVSNTLADGAQLF